MDPLLVTSNLVIAGYVGTLDDDTLKIPDPSMLKPVPTFTPPNTDPVAVGKE
jgi:hypothetical protein